MNKKSYIGKISELFNVPLSTLRYWESEGLVNFNRIPENNYRFWSMRTLRKLCDITFYRRLSIPIRELREFYSMNYDEIDEMLEKNREILCKKIKSMQDTVEQIDDKLKRIETIKELSVKSMQFIEKEFPAVRPFDLMNSNDLTNLVTYEKDLIVMIDYHNPTFYRYGIFVSDNYSEDSIIREKDEKPKLYLRILMRSEYDDVEKNNLNECYEYMLQQGYRPGLAMGKVLVSAFDDDLYNYYDTWIEAIKIHPDEIV